MAAPEPWFRNLTLHSLLSGACPWVPLPWLDDHLLARIRERLVRDWAREAGANPCELVIRILAGSERPFRPLGCLLAAVLAASWRLFAYFVRKVIRKLLFFLLIKEASDVASGTFHESYLLREALLARPSNADLGTDEAWRIRWAVEATCREIDTRPIHQILRRTLRGGRALITWGATPAQIGDDERLGRWKKLVDQVSGALWEQEGYLCSLERRLRAHLGSDRSEHPSRPATI